jgi:hypothetical protein
MRYRSSRQRKASTADNAKMLFLQSTGVPYLAWNNPGISAMTIWL